MPSPPLAERAPAAARPRITALDTLRGLTVLSMVLFHASYDAAYLYGLPLPWFTAGPFQDIWRASISWTFLFLAGWMTSLSRSNMRRSALYGAGALAVWAATSLAAVDVPVSFGILFCMAASTLVYAVGRPLLVRLPAIPAAVASLMLFALLWQVPRSVYPIGGFSWLGFPSPGFASGDYYPLIPFAFMYLAGAFAARGRFGAGRDSYPAWMRRDLLPPLTWIGRRSLIVYLVHQPLLILAFEVLAR